MAAIERGIKEGLVSFDADRKMITYLHQNKKRNYENPEEKVQVEAFLKLIFDYGYKPERIRQYEPVKMGADVRQADMIVYKDDECSAPHILVECKKQDVSEAEFQQAVEQAYSYAYALPNELKWVWVTSGIKDEYFEVDKSKFIRIPIPDIPQFGVNRLANYKFVYDAENIPTKSGEQKYSALSVIAQDELTKRFKQAHDALWGGGQLNPSEAFDELDKLIFCKIWDEKKDRKTGEPYDFQVIKVDEVDVNHYEKLGEKELRQAVRDLENKRLTERICNLYEEGRKKDPEVFRDNIKLEPEKIRTIVGYLEGVNLGDTDLDAKGRAFETFMDSFFRGNFGQFFTPRQIVKFVTDVLPVTNESIVLDTSCGSGGFLLYALDKVRKQADALYPNYKTDVKQYQRHYKYWHDFAEKNLFGIEISEQISRAAKMNMIIHDDGHTNVISADGLLSPEKLEEMTGNSGFRRNSFDFIVTNPPFGSIVRQTEKAYMKEYKLGKKEEDWLAVDAKPETQRENQSTEILFIEQAYQFLKEGGYLGIVIPDGILTNSTLQYVRTQIEEWFRIVAVVSMPATAFKATGAGVKSSTLFLRKWTKAETDMITRQKAILQQTIKKKHNYKARMEAWDTEKKRILKTWHGFDNNTGKTDKKAVEATDAFKTWKAEITAEYAQQMNELKEELNESYLTRKAQTLADYPIFLAIADEIGYDTTGRTTTTNDLDTIGEHLTEFIMDIEKKKSNLSQLVEPNKIYIVQFSELQGRIDPQFYKESFRFKNFVKLSKVAIVKGGKRIPLGKSYSEKETPYLYLRVSDMIDEEVVYNTLNFIEKDVFEMLERYEIKENDIALSIAGTIGKIIVIKNIPQYKRIILTENCAKVVLKDTSILSQYLELVLNLPVVQKQIELNYTQTTIPKLGLDRINNLQLPPFPNKTIQEQIVNDYQIAYHQKLQKEIQAQALLSSITDYLLGELGIGLPSENAFDDADNSWGFQLDKQNPLVQQGRIFLTSAKEITGGRFDPVYACYSGKKSKSAIYENVTLREIAKIGKGQSITSAEIVEGEYPVIAGGQSSPYSHNEYNNEAHVITVSASGSAGFVWYHDYPIFASDCSVIRSKNENLFSTRYIYEVLKAKQKEIYLLQQGAIQPHVYPADLARISIPVAPFPVQEKIIRHINDLRQQARQLQEEAIQTLQQAKATIQEMILG